MSVATEPTSTTTVQDPGVPDVPIYRLTVDQYHAIADAGILTEDDPVELLEGWLVQKMTKHKPHSIATRRLRRALERMLPAGWYVDSQEPITTVDSEPEPDVFVAREEVANDPARHPGPHEVALVVEVADSSLRQDRETKKRVYARAGIVVYWIVNLVERRIEVYTDPTSAANPPDYGQRQDFGPADTIPVVLDGTEVGRLAAEELLL
jgi:Uma2 family endonuclease